VIFAGLGGIWAMVGVASGMPTSTAQNSSDIGL
jgi:hypothetical protein